MSEGLFSFTLLPVSKILTHNFDDVDPILFNYRADSSFQFQQSHCDGHFFLTFLRNVLIRSIKIKVGGERKN